MNNKLLDTTALTEVKTYVDDTVKNAGSSTKDTGWWRFSKKRSGSIVATPCFRIRRINNDVILEFVNDGTSRTFDQTFEDLTDGFKNMCERTVNLQLISDIHQVQELRVNKGDFRFMKVDMLNTSSSSGASFFEHQSIIYKTDDAFPTEEQIRSAGWVTEEEWANS